MVIKTKQNDAAGKHHTTFSFSDMVLDPAGEFIFVFPTKDAVDDDSFFTGRVSCESHGFITVMALWSMG